MRIRTISYSSVHSPGRPYHFHGPAPNTGAAGGSGTGRAPTLPTSTLHSEKRKGLRVVRVAKKKVQPKAKKEVQPKEPKEFYMREMRDMSRPSSPPRGLLLRLDAHRRRDSSRADIARVFPFVGIKHFEDVRVQRYKEENIGTSRTHGWTADTTTCFKQHVEENFGSAWLEMPKKAAAGRLGQLGGAPAFEDLGSISYCSKTISKSPSKISNLRWGTQLRHTSRAR